MSYYLSFQIEDFLISITFFFFLLSKKSLKIKYLSHYKSVILIFLVNLPTLYIYKFCKKIHQPPGEPQEHHLGEVRPKNSSYTKSHTGQNDREGRYMYTQAHF